jgi:peptide/nickel transport system substrate-binding protein
MALPERLRKVALIASLALFASTFVILARTNDLFMMEIPQKGGSLTEGIIGRPRFINPVIARSDADRDMSELIYSGLLRFSPEGAIAPDLAERYEVSPDGLTYTFTLRPELFWHDGMPVTSSDVSFTIEKVGDPSLTIKSPRRASWEGVTVETPDPRTVIFRLKQSYAPFLENATMGILPRHIWENVAPTEFDVTYHNLKPIGSGPYRIERIVQDDEQGLPLYYDLVAFQRYARGEPYITHLRIQFFGNTNERSDAHASQQIDQMHTLDPRDAVALEENGLPIRQSPLPRVFAAFFNQNHQPLFTDTLVRQALERAVDRQAIVEEVLLGYGRPLDGPIPTNLNPATATSSELRQAEAREMLTRAGWEPGEDGVLVKTDKKKNTTRLSFSIAVPDVEELRHTAELLALAWETLGAEVSVKVYELSTFSADVLAPRKYDVIFYGQVIGRTPDLYPYWHSSQRIAPGLNISLYANKKVDTLLEGARKEHDPELRNQALSDIASIIVSEAPAIFVYSPDFLYATSPRLHGVTTGLMITESERFLGVSEWYTESERVWKWFAEKRSQEREAQRQPSITN